MKEHAAILAAIILGVVVMAAPVRADVTLTVNPSGIIANSCYTAADAEAEQAIRIRSELMVIGLNCQVSRYRGTPENLYAIYRQFVADHGPQFAAYEKQMIDYFGRAGSGDPEGDLNQMGTVFGNKFALGVAEMRPDMFCYKYAQNIVKARRLSSNQFHQWAVAAYTNHAPTHPLCR